MFTVIQRTHKAGRQIDAAKLESPMAGTIMRKSKYDAQARRLQVFMEFEPLRDPSKVLYQERPANLLDPQILSFDSEKGMMMTGFEVINGGRHYQGWWIRWYPEMPQWYADMMTPR
jgi:hypothetical protein